MNYDPMLLEALPQPASMIDTEGIIVDLNSAFVEMVHGMGRQLRKEDRIGYPVARFVPTGDAPTAQGQQRMAGFVQDLLSSEAPQCCRWALDSPSGKVYQMQVEGRPLKDAAGRLTGALLLWENLNEQLWQERQRVSRERLREAFWQMRQHADTDYFLNTLYGELKNLFPQVAACSVQILQTAVGQWLVYASCGAQHLEWEEWKSPGEAVETCWRKQRPVYRPDLTEEDPYAEAEHFQSGYSPQVRAVLDVPFFQGTLAVNSHQPHAFAEADIAALAELAHVLSAGLSQLAELKIQSRYRALVETSSDMTVMYLTPDGRYLYVSPQVTSISGYRPEEFYADNSLAMTIAHPDDAAMAEQAFLRVAAGASEERLEIRWQHRGGACRWALETLSPIHNPAGALDAVQVVLQDITQRKELEQELMRTERLRAAGELSAGLSHNLNNLLVGTLMPAQMLRQLVDDPECRELIELIITAGERARDLVHRLHLSVSDESEYVPVSLNDTLDAVVQATRPRWKDEPEARGRSISIVCELTEVPPIRGTESRLHDMLTVLLLNAVDAMPEGGQIRFETASEGNFVRLDCRDSGCGMDEKTKNRLFQPLFTTKMQIGAGLGLYTLHRTLTQWNGAIEVESAPGKGSVFSLRFPVWKEAVSAPEHVPAIASRTARILIVEDDERVGSVLRRLLERNRHQVQIFANPQEALDQFRPGQYEVAILDLGMPELSGDRVARQLQEADPAVARILFTGWQLSPDDPRQAGFDFHLQKPLAELDELDAVIAQALELNQQRASKRA